MSADTETDRDEPGADPALAAIVRAGCFDSEADALREAVQVLFSVKPHLRIEASVRRFADDEISLGRAAELAGMTRWRFQELLAQRGIQIVVEARSARDLDASVERMRKYRK